MLKRLLLSGLASLPLLSTAQTTPPAPSFYVGAGATLLTSQPFNRYSGMQLGPALTAGWQFKPRLALQLSGAYTWNQASYSYSYSSSLIPTDVNTSEYRTKLFTFPLLLRGELTAPTRRLHVDALVGPMLLFSSNSYHYTYSNQGVLLQDETRNSTGLLVSLALGPALRYSITPHLDVAADALVNFGLDSNYSNLADHLFSNILLGVNYRFNH